MEDQKSLSRSILEVKSSDGTIRKFTGEKGKLMVSPMGDWLVIRQRVDLIDPENPRNNSFSWQEVSGFYKPIEYHQRLE